MTTDTITLPRSVVEQAREALELYGKHALCNALRAAIEAAKEREAEPFYVVSDDHADMTRFMNRVANLPNGTLFYTAPPAPKAEPVFWYRPTSDGCYEGPIHNNSIEPVRKTSGAWKPLYTTPQPQVPAKKPHDKHDDDFMRGYCSGWNACVDDLLAAAPKKGGE